MADVELNQNDDVELTTFRNNSNGPVKLKVGPRGQDVNVPAGGTITGPVNILRRFIGVLQPVQQTQEVQNEDTRPVNENFNVEKENNVPDVEEDEKMTVPESEKNGNAGSEAKNEVEQSLIDKDVWHPNIDYMDFDELDYRKATNDELKFVLEKAGMQYDEDEKKNDLWSKIKTLI